MKAQVFRGVNQLSYEELPIPALEPDEVLVQVRVVGLCQSDIKKIRYPLYEPPRIFGHETAGTIAAVGEAVNDIEVGQRVVVMHHIPCMRCGATNLKRDSGTKIGEAKKSHRVSLD